MNHMVDFITYKVTDKNIGPHGKSKYTENKPFFIILHDDYKSDKRRKRYMKNIKKISSKKMLLSFFMILLTR